MRPTKPHSHAEAVRAYRPLAALVPEHWRAHTVAAPDGANLRVTDTGGEGASRLAAAWCTGKRTQLAANGARP